jgi:multiple sugar transport system substrate-binding protein
MLPQAADGIQHKGVSYGLPYYTECALWVYDEEILQRAGIQAPPATWAEVTEQALSIKRQGLAEHPIRLTYRLHAGTNIDWWSMVYARGGSFFDELLNPVFHLPGSAAEQTLAWILEGIYSTGIIHADVIDSSYEASLRNPTAFTIQPGYNFLFNVIEVEGRNRPNTRRIAPFPGNNPNQSGSVMWTRLYAIPSASPNKEAAWELLQYLGGLDRENRYFTPLFWFVNRSLGSAYDSLYDEPQVKSLAQERGLEDLRFYLLQRQVARTHEARSVPWFHEWEQFSQLEIQRALLRQIEPHEALHNMADKFYTLRVEWSAVTNDG